jgi:cytidine deaminase
MASNDHDAFDANLLPADQELISAAKAARGRAYAPYSRFAVGAAVRTASGAVFEGCNIENATYALCMCAERVALLAAMASGASSITEIAVVADLPMPISPCGACRQVLAEFAPRARVIMANLRGDTYSTTLDALLPLAFTMAGKSVGGKGAFDTSR